MGQTKRRGLYLLATTSVLALSLATAPVSVDLSGNLPGPRAALKMAIADSCCFTGETRVLMADGHERPIRDVRVGDLVLGPNGRANRVVGIEQPDLGARCLYALNGGAHFVTAEHPFATLGGWRAIDPAATRDEGSRISVGRLLIGDCLQVYPSSAASLTAGALAMSEPALRSVVLLSLVAGTAAADTPLFNLLLDGDHTYFANGYLVHNKEGGGEGGGEGEGDGSGGSSSGGSSGSGSSGSGSSGSGSGGGESSGSGSGSGSGESGESGESGDSGESGESGESGSSGSSSSSGSGSSGGSPFGGVDQVGPDLSPGEEADTISKGWQ